MMTKVMTYKLVLIVVGIGTFTEAQTDPTNIACTSVNSTALQLTWDQATDASVLGYFLHIERVDGLRIEPSIPSADLNSKSYDNYDFVGLGKYGTYNITIHSYTSGSNLTQYVETCTTAQDVPDGSPSTFVCTGISVNTISCSWNSLGQVYWNGVSLGYRIQWLSSNLSLLYEKTMDSNITTTLVTGLSYGTTYMLMLNPYTSIGHGTLYSTTTAATLGGPVEVAENVTRYFCNEAVPGMIEFAWEEMPCTIYAGTIGGLMVISGVFVCIICCVSCCGKSSGNNLNLNLFDAPSGGRRRHRDDDDDTDSDDENNGNISDGENIEDFDDDGYENKGYRSDEDAGSPEGRETETPDEDSKSPVDTPGTRHSGKMDSKVVAKFEQHRSKEDGRLSARDIELEPIDEDEDITDDDTPDSDYDTQSESEYELSNDDNRRGITKALPAKTVRPKQKGKKKIISSKDDNGVKTITASGKASIQARNKSDVKTAVTTVALIHTNETEENADNIDNNSYETETQYKSKTQNTKDTNDLDLYTFDSSVHSDRMTFTPSDGAAPGKTMVLKGGNSRAVSPDDDWDIADNGYNCTVHQNTSEDLVISTINNDKNTKSNNEKTNKSLRANDGNETRVNIADDKIYANDNIRNTRNNSAKVNNTHKYNATNDFELDSWGTPVVEGKHLIAETSNREISHNQATNDGEHFKSSSPSNDWGDNDGWGDVFTNHNNRGLSNKDKVNHLKVINGNSLISVDQQRTVGNKTVENNMDLRKFNTKTESAEIVSNNTDISLASGKPTNGKLKAKKESVSHKNEDASTNEKYGHAVQIARSKKISFRDQHAEPLKPKSSTTKSSMTEHKNRFFIEDELDHVTLSSEQTRRPKSEQNGKMIATRAWLPQASNESFKTGRKTPVKPLPKVQSWTSVEIEPILGSDRLGKRFPFLNIDNNSTDSQMKPDSIADIGLKKNISDSDLLRPASAQANVHDKRISADDVLAKFQKTKKSSAENIFYGFGTGRFRTVANAWLAKVRYKKSPVKTAQSDWR